MSAPAAAGRLLTTRQVAERLGLSPETVLRRWRAGELPGYRLASNVLRFDERDVLAWLEAHRESRLERLDRNVNAAEAAEGGAR